MNAFLMLHFACGTVGYVMCLIYAAVIGALMIELNDRIGGVS